MTAGIKLAGQILQRLDRVRQGDCTHTRQFASTILPVWAKVPIKLLKVLELGVAGCSLVGIAGLVADSHHVALLGGLFHQREQVRRENDMPHMIQSHVSVHTIVCELVSHDSAGGVVDQDVKSVVLFLDLLGHVLGSRPVGYIALEPFRLIRGLLAQVLGDGFFGSVNSLLGYGQNVDLGNVVFQERVGAAVSNALTSSRHHCDLASQVGDIIESELVCTQFLSRATKVLSNGVLDILSGPLWIKKQAG